MLSVIAPILSLISSLFGVFKKYPQKTIIVVLALSLVYVTQCKRCPECPEYPTIEQITPKPLVYPLSTYVPEVVYIPAHSTIKVIYDTVVKWKVEYINDVGDTMQQKQVYRKHYTPIYISDTIQDDTVAFISIHDVLIENEIKSRTVEKTFYPSIYNITTVKPHSPSTQVYVGFGIGGWNDKFGMSAKLSVRTKRESILGISYNPLNNYLEGSMLFKIKFKNVK